MIGPFPVGKTEIDGDPLEAYGGIARLKVCPCLRFCVRASDWNDRDRWTTTRSFQRHQNTYSAAGMLACVFVWSSLFLRGCVPGCAGVFVLRGMLACHSAIGLGWF